MSEIFRYGESKLELQLSDVYPRLVFDAPEWISLMKGTYKKKELHMNKNTILIQIK